MGAVTALLFCCNWGNIVGRYVSCIILDSPFTSVKELLYDFADEKV